MRISRVISITMCLAASGAVLGNYLWLIGVVPKPPSDLMDARWIYAGITYLIGALVLAVGELDT